MTIKLVTHDTTGELILDGRLDSMAAPEVEPIFNQTAERFDAVVLDFANLQYISSAGLRVIKILYMAMRKKNGTLTLKNVNKTCMEVFEMTGFAGLLTIV